MSVLIDIRSKTVAKFSVIDESVLAMSNKNGIWIPFWHIWWVWAFGFPRGFYVRGDQAW